MHQQAVRFFLFIYYSSSKKFLRRSESRFVVARRPRLSADAVICSLFRDEALKTTSAAISRLQMSLGSHGTCSETHGLIGF